MHLVGAEFENYRRFGGRRRSIDLRESLIALVGPNEVGKSTLLQGLAQADSANSLDGGHKTRGAPRGARTALRLRFQLDEDDRQSLERDSGLPRKVARICGELVVELDERCRHTSLAAVPAHESAWEEVVAADRRKLAESLLTSAEQLKKKNQKAADPKLEVRRVAERVRDDPGRPLDDQEGKRLVEARKNAAGTADVLRCVDALVEGAARLAFPQAAATLDEERRPGLLFFDDDNRDLHPRYKLAGNAEGEKPNRALTNLVDSAQAGLLEGLTQAARANDQPRLDELQETVNKGIRAAIADEWTQAPVVPRVRVDAGTLHVHVDEGSPAGYSPIAERSDGLRQFVALAAFVKANVPEGATKPVVLVDEAERHLHYDAQADLVQVMLRQRAASKIIYSTHSAGYLPPDIYNDVRVLRTVPRDEAHTDTDVTSVEMLPGAPARGQAGFDPLLLAMGASTFAFTATRYAVVAEGVIDAMLFPSLLRESRDGRRSNTDTRGEWQFVPGLSEVANEALPLLEESGGRVVYLLDNDGGGRDQRKRLIKRAGIDPMRALLLPSNVCTVEDLVHPATFVSAVNGILDAEGLAPALDEKSLPGANRWTWIANFLGRHGLGKRSVKALKRPIAHRLLRDHRAHAAALVDPTKLRGIRRVDDRIAKAFDDDRNRPDR